MNKQTLSDKIVEWLNSLEYMENPTRTEIGDKVFELTSGFIKRLKEELESDKYTDYEYSACQSFTKKTKAVKELDEDVISWIIDKLAGDKLI